MISIVVVIMMWMMMMMMMRAVVVDVVFTADRSLSLLSFKLMVLSW